MWKRPLAIVALLACLIPTVSLTAEVVASVRSNRYPDAGWLVWLLMLIGPYLMLAVAACLDLGRGWTRTICAGSLLVGSLGLLAQLDVIGVRGFYGLGWMALMSLQWLLGCWILLVAGLFWLVSRSGSGARSSRTSAATEANNPGPP
jgi:hypothetical protein